MTRVLRWKKVVIGFKGAAPRNISSADDAAFVLLHAAWHDISSTDYIAAKMAVLNEIEKRAPVASAREPFIKAAKMAGILLSAE